MKDKVNTSYIKLDFTISICAGESTTTVTMTLMVVKMAIIFSSHANIVFHVLTRDTTLKEIYTQICKFTKKIILRLFTGNPNHHSLI